MHRSRSSSDYLPTAHQAFDRQIDAYRNVTHRPSLAPLCLCALSLWALCALSYAQGRILDSEILVSGVIVASVGAVLGVLIVVVRTQYAMVGLIIASAFLGVVIGLTQAYALKYDAQRLDSSESVVGTLVLLEDGSSNGFSESAKALLQMSDGRSIIVQARFPQGYRAQRSQNRNPGSSATGRETDSSAGSLLYGRSFLVTGRSKSIDYGIDSYAWQNSFVATFQVDEIEDLSSSGLLQALISLRSAAIDSYEEVTDESAILQAITCGYRQNLKERSLYGSYQRCGLAHLVAVSGAHLVIVTGLFASAFRRLKLPRKLIIVLLVSIMLSYLVLSGAPISALRATIMSSVGILALLGKRRPSSQNALGVSIFMILLVDPSSSISLSFALSALSTLGIILFAPLFSSWFDRTPLRRFPFVTEALSLTCAASLLSQGLACSVFSLLPLISPLANIVVAPLFPFVCSSGLIAGLFQAFGLPGGEALLSIALFGANLMNTLIGFLASIPYAALPFACETPIALAFSCLGAAAIWMGWNRIKKGFIFVAVACAITAYVFTGSATSDRIIMLDVGQGDAFILQSKGETILIDTGNQDTKLIAALARERIASLDMIALSHPDDDHVGSIDAAFKSVQVGVCAVPEGLLLSDDEKSSDLREVVQGEGGSLIGLNVGDSFAIGAFSFVVLWPKDYEGGNNADSLCLWVEYDGDDDGHIDFTALFTGDLEINQLQDVIDRYGIEHVDILKIGHHGSKNALTYEQIHVLSPRLALISVGANNRYGHPAASVIEALEQDRVAILRSDTDGQKAIVLTPNELVVQ